jgi:hypothetical protein
MTAALAMSTGLLLFSASPSKSENSPEADHWSVPLTSQEALDGNEDSAGDAGAHDMTATTRTEGAVVGGVTWPLDSEPSEVKVRFRTGQGEWTSWTTLDTDSDHGPDPGSEESSGARGGTGPIVIGDADIVQVRAATTRRDGIRLDLVDPGHVPAPARPGEVSSTFNATDTPPATPAEPDTLADPVPRPQVYSRADWGADESLRTQPSSYSSTIYGGWVHHTAGSNSYSSADVPAIIRGIYIYHVRSRGWSDIGYNFLVDRFGRIWEGRYGGIDRPVIGAHTGGYNTNTFGVSAIGNFEQIAPTSSLVNSVSALIAWKLGTYGRNPAGTTRTLDGSDRPVVGGHKDASATACPGRYLYAQLPYIRDRASAIVMSNQVGGDTATPVAGDVDGDGVADIGWFQQGRWAFRVADQSIVRFSFGRAGDIPVLADFDNDDAAEPGVFRDGSWHLRNDASSGTAWRTFIYGRAGDIPLAGRWPGTSAVGVAIVRENTWHLRTQLSGGPGEWSFRFGRATDTPIVGNWTGGGTARPAVVRDGMWYFATSVRQPTAEWSYRFGWSEDSPVVVDWDGDGIETAAVTRGIAWHLRANHAAQSSVVTVDFVD